jgi:hypothetical protein
MKAHLFIGKYPARKSVNIVTEITKNTPIGPGRLQGINVRKPNCATLYTVLPRTNAGDDLKQKI